MTKADRYRIVKILHRMEPVLLPGKEAAQFVVQFPTILAILTIAVCTLTSFSTAESRTFREVELLSGAEPLSNFGIDTTDNWWAITQPFSNQFRLIVNGEETETFDQVSPPVFSHNGLFWQTFAVQQNVLTFVSNIGDTWLDYTSAEPAEFSLDSRCVAFTAYDVDQGWSIRYGIEEAEDGYYDLIEMQRFPVLNKVSRLFLAPDGAHVAYVGLRGGSQVVAIDDRELAVYDQIEPFGFLSNGSFLYAARLGDLWRLYRDENPITASYNAISNGVFNQNHDMFAFVATGPVVSYPVLISEPDGEPDFGEQQESITSLAIHPFLALLAYQTINFGAPSVKYGSARYSATVDTGVLSFSHDGEDLFYLECDVVNCYMNVNGKRYDLSTTIDTRERLVTAPGTQTFGFTTGLTLVVRSFDGKDVLAGMLVDKMGQARFNWRQNRYEALGVINDRLYLLYCAL